jgi:hypothetical protein
MRTEHDERLAEVRDEHQRARSEATLRSLSVNRTDWHDSLDRLADSR